MCQPPGNYCTRNQSCKVSLSSVTLCHKSLPLNVTFTAMALVAHLLWLPTDCGYLSIQWLYIPYKLHEILKMWLFLRKHWTGILYAARHETRSQDKLQELLWLAIRCNLSSTMSEATRNQQHRVDSGELRLQDGVANNSNLWSTYAGEVYRSQRPPLLTSVRVHRIAELTKEKMRGRDGAYSSIYDDVYDSDKLNCQLHMGSYSKMPGRMQLSETILRPSMSGESYLECFETRTSVTFQ